MTAPGAATTPQAGAARLAAARPPRQAPADLTVGFVDEATVRQAATLLEEPQWLLEERLAGLRGFEDLPIEANFLYTPYVDLRNARLSRVRPYMDPQRRVLPEGTDARLLPEGAAGYAEVREDRLPALVLDPALREKGVILDTLAGLRERDPELARRLLAGGSTLPAGDKLAQMTRALWTQGLVLHVPDGVRIERPIVLRWAMGAPGAALLSRTIISLGDEAQASIVEEQLGWLGGEEPSPGPAGPDAEQALFAGTTEVRLGAGSNLAFASLQDFSLREVAFQHRSAVIGRSSSMRWALAQLGSRVVRSRVDNRLEGDGSTVEQAEILFGSSDQLFDLTSYTRHLGRDTTGNLLSKGALADRSRAYLKGLITIDKPAHGTDSFLGEFGMLLSRQARSVAIPSLEIDQPDCRRAAHASSVGPIDETQLFYLESRGVPPDEARKFIVLGYLEPVVAMVPLESVQERLRELLEAKWVARTGRPAAA